jgi:hypothetical protein
MAKSGKVGAVLMQTEDPAATFTDEATTPDAGKTRYTITDTNKKYWDKNTPVTVKKNGVVQTNGYTIEYPGGVIVFDAALTTETILVSGKYITVDQPGGFFSWSLNVANKLEDVSDFETVQANGGWEVYAVTNKNFSCSAQAFWANSERFINAIKNGTEVILVLYDDYITGASRSEGYALIESEDTSDIVPGAVIKRQISFKGTQGLYARAG